MLVFRITTYSENKESQEDVNGHPDCIQTVSDGDAETEIVPKDPEPEGEGDAICVQPVQNEYELYCWVTIIWYWVKSLFWYQ